MQVRFCDIQWDTYGDDVDLPSEVTLEVDDDIDIEYEGADVLSDAYGWCIEGFNFKVVDD